MRALERLGTALLSGIFIRGGYHAARDPCERTKAAERLGFPRPELVVRLNGAAMVLGGLSLLTGIKSKRAAAGLVASLIPTTYSVHAFWQYEDPAARELHLREFLKNAAALGGLLVVLSERP